ncbi:MAG: hypothetical protein INQ03_16950 [Candidatus Heimdallarchaeota archaeon]|nr:hypothetical protein [Candidatus Heimdallarchaeota archaeon]
MVFLSDISGWLISFLKELAPISKAAEENPGWADGDFEHRTIPEVDAFYNKIEVIYTWIAELPAPKGWIDLAKWCDENNDFIGGFNVGMFVDWDEKKYSINRFLLQEIYERICRREISNEEHIWSNPDFIDMIKNTNWYMPPLLTADEDLLHIIHFMGENGFICREGLTPLQIKKIEYLDEKKAYFKVNNMDITVDKKYVNMRVEFEDMLPIGTLVGVEAMIWDEQRILDVVHDLDFEIKKISDKEFVVSTNIIGGKLIKGKDYVIVSRPRGGWKPFNLKEGTPIALHLHISRYSSYLKERFGEDWFPMPGGAYYCIKASIPEYQ